MWFQIADLGVFGVTAVCSVFAYIWLLVILVAATPNVVTVTEGALTFGFFPVLVMAAYAVDKGYCKSLGLTAPARNESTTTLEMQAGVGVAGGNEGAIVNPTTAQSTDDPEAGVTRATSTLGATENIVGVNAKGADGEQFRPHDVMAILKV